MIQLLTSGGPNNSTMTIMYYIYHNAFNLYKYGYGNAMGVILAIIIALLSAADREGIELKYTVREAVEGSKKKQNVEHNDRFLMEDINWVKPSIKFE